MSDERQSVPSTAGTTILDLFHSFEALVGREAMDAALARISESDRAHFADVTPAEWVPVTALGAWIEALGEVLDEDPDPILDEAVRRATDRTFRSVWRVFLRFTSDESLVRRTPAMYARSRNVGQLEVVHYEEGYAQLLLTGWPTVSDRHARTLGVSIVRVLELCGRDNPSIRFEREGDEVRFHLRISDAEPAGTHSS